MRTVQRWFGQVAAFALVTGLVASGGEVTTALAQGRSRMNCRLQQESCQKALVGALEEKSWEEAIRLADELIEVDSEESKRRELSGGVYVEWFPRYWKAMALVELRRWEEARSALKLALERPEKDALMAKIAEGERTAERGKVEVQIKQAVTAEQLLAAQRAVERARQEERITEVDAESLRKEITDRILRTGESLGATDAVQAKNLLMGAIEQAAARQRSELKDGLDALWRSLWDMGKAQNGSGDARGATATLVLASDVAREYADLEKGAPRPATGRDRELLDEQLLAVRLKLAIQEIRGGRQPSSELLGAIGRASGSGEIYRLARLVAWAAAHDRGNSATAPDEVRSFANGNRGLAKGSISASAAKALGL